MPNTGLLTVQISLYSIDRFSLLFFRFTDDIKKQKFYFVKAQRTFYKIKNDAKGDVLEAVSEVDSLDSEDSEEDEPEVILPDLFSLSKEKKKATLYFNVPSYKWSHEIPLDNMNANISINVCFESKNISSLVGKWE